MVITKEKGKRRRSRAPVSCLNCKKRKIRCDKGRPCSGCVRNNVGHLCVYLDPKWAESLRSAAETGPADVCLTPRPDHAELQRKIDAQAMEIKCLRAQLVQKTNNAKVEGGLTPNSDTGKHDMQIPKTPLEMPPNNVTFCLFIREIRKSKTNPVTVLTKLSGHAVLDMNPPTIMHDNFYSMSGFRKPLSPRNEVEPAHAPSTTLYSWLSIIKIDPHLTTLWFRITNLQKSYHMYKTSLLKLKQPLHHAGHSTISSMERSVSAGSADTGNCGHRQCPVVACEFNLMLEESDGANSESVNSTVIPQSETDFSDLKTCMKNGVKSEDALEMLGSLQGLWSKILGSGRNAETLNYQQLEFLVHFYMDPGAKPENNDAESRHLLSFFSQEILALFSANGAEAMLEVGSFSPKMSDAEVTTLLKLKALYMSMLALTVDESLDWYYMQDTTSHPALPDFRRVFPLENAHLGTGHAVSGILGHVLNLTLSLLNPEGPVENLDSLMAAFSLLVALLNRLCLLYERKHLPIDVRDSFMRVFVLLFETLTKNENVLQIWCDPAEVVFLPRGSVANLQEKVGVLLCHLWNDFLRLVNNVTFNILPFLRHGAHIDTLVDSLLMKVPQIEALHAHVAYLGQIRDMHALTGSLQAQYMIARCSVMLRDGINGDCFVRAVSVADFLALVADMSETCRASETAKPHNVRHFETLIIFQYLQFFFFFIMLLQFEENGDCDAMARLMPLLFEQFVALNKFLQEACVQYAKDRKGNYAGAVIAETFARMSHLASGLLIRFKPESKTPPGGDSDLLVYISRTGDQGPEISISMAVCRKAEIIREADRTANIIEATIGREAALHRTKIWKFYQTFIRNSHKMNPTSYANVHAEAFGAGRFIDQCPITRHATSATRMELSNCPVFQGKVSSARRPVPPVCSFFNIAAPKGVKTEQAFQDMPPAGKCPFEHDSVGAPPMVVRKRNPVCMQDQAGYFPMQSPLLGRIAKYTPPLCAPAASPFAPVSAAAASTTDMLQAPLMGNAFLQVPPFGDIDWDSLPNFSFDTIEDEALMGQLNSSDFNNPIIEGFF